MQLDKLWEHINLMWDCVCMFEGDVKEASECVQQWFNVSSVSLYIDLCASVSVERMFFSAVEKGRRSTRALALTLSHHMVSRHGLSEILHVIRSVFQSSGSV